MTSGIGPVDISAHVVAVAVCEQLIDWSLRCGAVPVDHVERAAGEHAEQLDAPTAEVNTHGETQRTALDEPVMSNAVWSKAVRRADPAGLRGAFARGLLSHCGLLRGEQPFGAVRRDGDLIS